MYNMGISIFGYKLNLQVLILIGVIYLILVGHTICGCSNRNLMEAFTDASGNVKKANEEEEDDEEEEDVPLPAGGSVANKSKGTVQSKEGFVGANTNYGNSSRFDLNSDDVINTSSWSAPNMTVVPGQPLNPAVKQFLAREPQPVPLPEGEMFMFANTPFKPECCPSNYSNSSGCACMTGAQYNFLKLRGSNNVPFSEY
jgi:hypothetical protein